METQPHLRPATDADAAAVISLIRRVFAEYPGCLLDVDGEEPELKTPASSFERFWVLESDGKVVGCCGCALHEPGALASFVELKKLYVDRVWRGCGLGKRLIEEVEAHARRRGLSQVELWSDTRFKTSHAVYEHLGYRRSGRLRELADLSDTKEYHFSKSLR